MKQLIRYIILLLVLGGMAAATAVGLTSGRAEGVLLPTGVSQELTRLAEDLARANLPVGVAYVEEGGVGAYSMSAESASWREYIVLTDDILRNVSVAKAAGVLSLDYVDLAVAPPAIAGQEGVSPTAPQPGFVLRINGIEPGPWGANPDETLAVVRKVLVADVERLGQKYDLDVAGVEVVAEKGTQILSVHLVAERSGDGARLSMFRDELWGGVVPQINSGSGSVGLGYLDVKDLSGNQLLFELSDFMIGWTNAHSEMDYPPSE